MTKPTIPKPPDGLSARAGALWGEIVAEYELDTCGLLLLDNALSAFDRMRQAQARLKKDGLVIKDRFQQLRPHPMLKAEHDAKGAMLANIRALGLDLAPLQDGPGRPAGGR